MTQDHTETADSRPELQLDQARRFLTALDPSAGAFCFQAFADRGRNRALARTLHGSLNELAPTLARLNQQGAGIFVTINEIAPGVRRLAEHVTRVRALFADADDPARLLEIEAAIARVMPAPSMIVDTSPGKRHFYWLCNDCPLESFTAAQTALIDRLGTDRTIKDLPRVMRLPGFFHLKGEPFRVRLVTP